MVEGATLGKVTVRVTNVTLFEIMQITLVASTDDEAAKISYYPIRKMTVPASDNFGNKYTTMLPRLYNQVHGTSVSKGQPIQDEFFLERPINSAEYIDVDIPGDIVGESGAFRFRILATSWTAKK
mgnify:CR=1 FL=1